MISFPDDNAHCEGANCDKRNSCLRYLALQDKRKTSSGDRRLVYIFRNPETCQEYWEVK